MQRVYEPYPGAFDDILGPETTPMTDVTQADREAAASVYLRNVGTPHSLHDTATAAEIEMGLRDDWPEVQAFARHRSPDTARIAALEEENARLREAANILRTEAVLHFNNSVGCATNHYGEDFEAHGLPSWIKDSANRIERATTALEQKP
jgi:hypothetical protein